MSGVCKWNLLSHLPENLDEEAFESIAQGKNVRIERIVSKGHRTPQDEWYDQQWDEWVVLLQGAAKLRFDGVAELMTLGPGDSVTIPAHCRHQVAWTTPDQETIWLAVHFDPVA